MIKALFAAIDCKDVDRFLAFISPKCLFRFGNQPFVTGSQNIREYICNFFASIDTLQHEIVNHVEIPGGVVCHGYVTYTRFDGSVLKVPFANIFKTESTGIVEYLIFADTSQLYS
jgi:hypothetical protein